MREIEFSETGIVKKPWPLDAKTWEWVGKPTFKGITRIEVDYGNGRIVNEYVDRETLWDNEVAGLVHARRIDGKSVLINPSKIVEVEDFILAICKYHCGGENIDREYLVMVDDGVEVICKSREE